MSLRYGIRDDKLLRVIVDTDAACEADDPFAIVHALLSKKLIVRAVCAEHFNEPGSVEKSFAEIRTILDLLHSDVPALMGETMFFSESEDQPLSPAAQGIIDEALREDTHPLFVCCLGAITNVAAALRACPEIAQRLTVIWIGGQDPDAVDPDFREFNARNDVDAANYVLGSGVPVWQVPNTVYSTMQIGIAEIQRRIAPCGAIGKHLFDQLAAFNVSEGAFWVIGEAWSLGDSPAIGLALSPGCGKFVERPANIILPDTTYQYDDTRPTIRVCKSIDSRFILEDMIAKLELCCGNVE